MSGTAGPTFASRLPLLVNTLSGTAGPTKPVNKNGASQNCAPRSTVLIRRRTPITRAASGVEAFEFLSLFGLGGAGFGAEGDGVVAALDGFAIAELAGFVAGFRHAGAANEQPSTTCKQPLEHHRVTRCVSASARASEYRCPCHPHQAGDRSHFVRS